MHPQRRQNQPEYYGYYQQPQYHPQHAAPYPQQWYPQYPVPVQYQQRLYHPMPPQHTMPHGPMIVSSTPQPQLLPQMRQNMVSPPAIAPVYPVNESPAPNPALQPAVPLVPTYNETVSFSSHSPAQEEHVVEFLAVPERRTPWYPDLPWSSDPDYIFPPRAPRRKRKQKQMSSTEALQFPLREDADHLEDGSAVNDSETSGLADSSSFEHDGSSVKHSEIETNQTTPLPPATPDQSPLPNKQTPSKAVRPVVPAVPVAPRPSSQGTHVQSSQGNVPNAVSASETIEDAPAEENVAAPEKTAPKSWADLVRSKAAANAALADPNSSAVPATMVLGNSTSSGLADVLRTYTVKSAAKVAFTEPRGLVNTGNMCYMNSVSCSEVSVYPLTS
jgi:ubiquitin carboxyl-terminal hydrolase 10